MKQEFNFKDIFHITIEYISIDALLKKFKSFENTYMLIDSQRSEIIESILIDVPIKNFYLLAIENGKFDGTKTRFGQYYSEKRFLSVVNEFMNDKFKLKDIQFLKEIRNKKYSQIDSFYQRKIKEKRINCFIFSQFMEKNLIEEVMRRIHRIERL